jgi:uncharacterized phage-associated protein
MVDYRFKSKKLDECIWFFVKHANNEHFGKTKLMKLLYYADFDSFEQFGEPITGATYLRWPQGPVPRQAETAQDLLAARHKIAFEPVPSGNYERFAYRLLEEPEYTELSERDLSVLHAVADRWKHHSLEQIVAATHGEAPWLAVLPNREIPYHLALYRNTYGELDLDPEELEAGPEDEDSQPE